MSKDQPRNPENDRSRYYIAGIVAGILAAVLLCGFSGCAVNSELEKLVAEARASAASATSGGAIPQTVPYEDQTTVIPGIAVSEAFDPFAPSLMDVELAELLYLRLFRLDAEGIPIPELCEKYEITDNGYIFTLKSGVTFANGKEITVRDVVYSLSCAEEYAHVNGEASFILNETDAGLPARLSEIPIIPLGSRAMDIPLSSAGYRLNGNEITDRDGNILYKLIRCKDSHAWMMAYQKGEISSIQVYGAEKDAVFIHGRARQEELPSRTLIYLKFNPESSLFSDVTMRRRIYADIGRDALAGDWAKEAYTFAPEWSYCYTPELLNMALDCIDVNRGTIYGSVQLLVLDDAGFLTDTAQRIADDLRNVGIIVTVCAQKSPDYISTLAAGTYDFILVSETLPIDLSPAEIVGSEYAQEFEASHSTEAFSKMQKRLLEDCPVIPILFTRGIRYTHIEYNHS